MRKQRESKNIVLPGLKDSPVWATPRGGAGTWQLPAATGVVFQGKAQTTNHPYNDYFKKAISRNVALEVMNHYMKIAVGYPFLRIYW